MSSEVFRDVAVVVVLPVEERSRSMKLLSARLSVRLPGDVGSCSPKCAAVPYDLAGCSALTEAYEPVSPSGKDLDECFYRHYPCEDALSCARYLVAVLLADEASKA